MIHFFKLWVHFEAPVRSQEGHQQTCSALCMVMCCLGWRGDALSWINLVNKSGARQDLLVQIQVFSSFVTFSKVWWDRFIYLPFPRDISSCQKPLWLLPVWLRTSLPEWLQDKSVQSIQIQHSISAIVRVRNHISLTPALRVKKANVSWRYHNKSARVVFTASFSSPYWNVPKLLLVCLFHFSSSPWGRYLIPFRKHYLWTQNARNMSLQIVCTTCPEPSYWHLLMSVLSADISLSFCCKPDLLMWGCFHMNTTIVTDKLHSYDLSSSVPVVHGYSCLGPRVNV